MQDRLYKTINWVYSLITHDRYTLENKGLGQQFFSLLTFMKTFSHFSILGPAYHWSGSLGHVTNYLFADNAKKIQGGILKLDFFLVNR